MGELGIDSNVSVLDSLLGGGPSTPLISGKVEGDEKNKVTGEDTTAGNGSKFLTGAFTVGGELGKVSGAKVGVSGKVYEDEVDHELGDLESGDPLFPPNLDASSRLEVVPVHDNVDGKVEGDGNPGLIALALVGLGGLAWTIDLQPQCFQRAGCSTIKQ